MPSREVLELAYQHGSCTEVGRQFGVSAQTAWRWLRCLGIELRSRNEALRLPKPRSNGLYRSEEWLRTQYLVLGRSMAAIASELGSSTGTVLKWCHKYGIPSRSTSAANKLAANSTRYPTGANHPRWKGGRFVHPRTGYVYLYVNGKYRSEHRLVVEKRIGRLLSSDEIVHHVNGIKTDNRYENLRLLTSREHSPVLHLQEQLQQLQERMQQLETENARLQSNDPVIRATR